MKKAKSCYQYTIKELGLLSVVVVTGVCAITILVMPLGGQSTDPVWIEWITPTNGDVYGTAVGRSNVILSIKAGSSVAPIMRVEFSRDGVLIGTWTNTYPPPGNLRTN